MAEENRQSPAQQPSQQTAEEKPEFFTFHRAFAESIRYMEERQQLESFWAITNYALEGREPNTNDNTVKMVFNLIKTTMNNEKQSGRKQQTVEEKPEHFMFHRAFAESIRYMEKGQQLESFWAITNYALEGREPNTNDNTVRMVFNLIKITMDNEKQSGRKGRGNA